MPRTSRPRSGPPEARPHGLCGFPARSPARNRISPRPQQKPLSAIRSRQAAPGVNTIVSLRRLQRHARVCHDKKTCSPFATKYGCPKRCRFALRSSVRTKCGHRPWRPSLAPMCVRHQIPSTRARASYWPRARKVALDYELDCRSVSVVKTFARCPSRPCKTSPYERCRWCTKQRGNCRPQL